MLNINKIEKTNTYEFEINGVIDQENANNLYQLIEQKAEDKDPINLLGVVRSVPKFEDLSAFNDTIQARKNASKCVNKYAVVSNIDWLKSAFPLAEILNTNIPIKYFHLEEKDKAIGWLEKKEVPEFSPDEYLTDIKIEHVQDTNIYQFKIDEVMDEAGVQALYELIKSKSKNGKIRLLAEINSFPKLESFKTFIDGLKLDFESLGVVEKYAVVSDEKLIKGYTKVGDFFTPNIPIKAFSNREKSDAIEWLKND